LGLYRHPETCNRGRYPTCANAFGEDPSRESIIGAWLEDPGTDARVIRAMIYIWLMNELDAVDYLATIFYDTAEMPMAFHHDAARHLWDESRHSQFGFRQLPRLGYDLAKIQQQVELYAILVRMSPAERYAMMTMEFESGSFPIKAVVMDRVHELDDFETDTLLAFDRNDEQNHVRYGHKWIKALLDREDDEGDVEKFLNTTRETFTRLKNQIASTIPDSLPPEDRVTAINIRERETASPVNS
jgi:uncharacterized ferritin-like protein (DUF455 family)